MEVKIGKKGKEVADDYVDIVVDEKMTIHLKRNDVGYSLDIYDIKGNFLEGTESQVWDEDLEVGEEDDDE